MLINLLLMVGMALFGLTVACLLSGIVLVIASFAHPEGPSCGIVVGGFVLVILSIPMGTAAFTVLDKQDEMHREKVWGKDFK